MAAEHSSVDLTGSAPSPFLSVIIPAFNEERRIPTSLGQVMEYLATQNYASEVIVVDDGSTDKTRELVQELVPRYPTLRLLAAEHGGKGHACKEGVGVSRGQWLFLCDSDLSMPIEDLDRFMPLLRSNIPIVIASREVPGARRIGEPGYRHLMGRVFNFIVRTLAVPTINDTQCGFKCFRADAARSIFSVQTIDGWGFDVELLYIARKRGYTIAEVPIDWYYRSNSKIKPVQDTLNMLREIIQVRLNDLQGHYSTHSSPSPV